MTNYLVTYASDEAAGATVQVCLQAVSYDILVTAATLSYSIIYSSTNATSRTGNSWRYSGGVSGGSALAIVPLRDGAPAATALCVLGGTVSGASVPLYQNQQTAQAGDGGAGNLMLSPGHTLVMQVAVGGSSWGVTFNAKFEEQRLSWHF